MDTCPRVLKNSTFGNHVNTCMTKSLTSHSASALKGHAPVPGDKSISHRALMLASCAVGESRISGLLESEDVMRTRDALSALGVTIRRRESGGWTVDGVGVGGLQTPQLPLDLGNSGTGVRLLMGLTATTPLTVTFYGDASLSRRPMGRAIEPLEKFGAHADARHGGRLPLTLKGSGAPVPIRYRTGVPSAQVKSAILLAGLNAPGTTIVEEQIPTRDHTERMLRLFGADVAAEHRDGVHRISLQGQPELSPVHLQVPGDPSSAAFPAVAALLVPGSEIVIERICVNPRRTGLYQVLADMGSDIRFVNKTVVSGETVADLKVKAAALKAVETDPATAASMIDEFPILFIAASMAEGKSIFRGLAELRVKESDRLRVMAEGLKANGVKLEEFEDGIAIEGCGGPPHGGGEVKTHLDHRIAMAFLVLGMAAEKPVSIDDGRPIATSFPGFADLMNRLGARIERGDMP